MGVTGLQTYLLQCPQAAYRVNLKQLVEEYKRAKGVDQVTIVTSGNSLMGMIYGDLNCLCGGQYKEFKANVENFVRAFESLGGVKLVVFFEGSTTLHKRSKWISLRYRKVGEALEVFSRLRKGHDFTADDPFVYMPTSLGMVEHFVFKLVCACDVRISVGECDEEIVDFARSQNCFAFLGLNTDFVIQNCFYHFISLHDIDLSEMTALKYDTLGLARALRIPPGNLPLLATLCGNDFIKAFEDDGDDLRTFHRDLIREYRTQQKPYRVAAINAVAAYVRTLPAAEEIFAALPKIALKVFGNRDRADDLEQSIRFYLPKKRPEAHSTPPPEPSSPWEEILMKAREAFCGGETRSIYSILIKQPMEMTNALEDYLPTAVLPLTPNLYLPLRQRTYGVLLKEKPGGPGLIEEWCCTGMNSLEKPTYVEPVVPPEELHPGLLTLWGDGTADGTADGDIVDTRWKLFAHSVSAELSADGLRSLADGGSPHLVVPTAILKYLRGAIPRDATASSPQYLQDWELEAFAIQAVLLTSTDPSRVIVQTPYDVRAIQLATIFMRAASQMMLLLASCGFPIAMAQAMPWLYFDGKLFHHTYVGLRNKKHVESMCVNQDGKSMMQDFFKVREIVLGST